MFSLYISGFVYRAYAPCDIDSRISTRYYRRCIFDKSQPLQQVVYHYHVQAAPPFTIGCWGPDVVDLTNDAGEVIGKEEALMTLARCRELNAGCGGGDTVSLTARTSFGGEETKEYDPW